MPSVFSRRPTARCCLCALWRAGLRLASVLALLAVALAPHLGRAQAGAPVFAPQASANVFAALDAAQPIDALLLRLPSGWTLSNVVVLRYGATPVPLRTRAAPSRAGAYLVEPDHALRGPHDVVVKVATGGTTGSAAWSLTPLRRDDEGSGFTARPSGRIEQAVQVRPRPEAGENRALRLRPDGPPLRLRPDALPPLDSQAGFTVEAWIRTTALDAVVLSTWAGDERQAYPLELVIDPSGRLRYYAGRSGRHHTLVTRTPVADGTWHHVALSYDAAARTARLCLEGVPVDSLRGFTPGAPALGGLAVGGRLPGPLGGAASTGPARVRLDGWVDDLRVWAEARTPEALRQAAYRSFDRHDDRVAAFSFDTPPPPQTVAPRGPTRRAVPSPRSGRPVLDDLRARVLDEGGVRLTWTTAAPEAPAAPTPEAIVVERSTDGQRFTAVGTLTLADATPLAPGTDGTRWRFTDDQARGQVLYYRVRQRFAEGYDRLSGTLKVGLGSLPTDSTARSRLIGNFPNPFAVETTLIYQIETTEAVTLSVWNLAGHRVADLVDEVQTPGRYELTFRGQDLPSGTYFVRLQTPSTSSAHRMVLLR